MFTTSGCENIGIKKSSLRQKLISLVYLTNILGADRYAL